MRDNCICEFICCIKESIKDCFCPCEERKEEKPDKDWGCRENPCNQHKERCICCQCRPCCQNGGWEKDRECDKKEEKCFECKCRESEKKDFDYKREEYDKKDYGDKRNDDYGRKFDADEIFKCCRSGRYQAQSDKRMFY